MRLAMMFSGKVSDFRNWLKYAFSSESPYYHSENGIADVRYHQAHAYGENLE